MGSTEWNPRDGPELLEEAHAAGKWRGQDWKHVDQILHPCWNPGVRKRNLALSLFLYILEHSHPHHIWLMAAFVLQAQRVPATQCHRAQHVHYLSTDGRRVQTLP